MKIKNFWSFKKYRWQKHLRKVEEGLPDCFTMIANAMRSGLSFSQALEIASQESHPSLCEELRVILERVKLGRSLEEALLASEKRLKIPDFSLMVHSVIILRQIGGNFVSHFENLVRVLRERQKVSAKIRLLTTQGLTQGIILGLMPVALGVGFYFLSPDFISALWESPLGWIALALILALDAGGYLWMKKMAEVEV